MFWIPPRKCIVYANLKEILNYKYVVRIVTIETQLVNVRGYINLVMCPYPPVALTLVSSNVFYVPSILRTGLKPGSPAGES
jgi:hypothetical protein